ncbi:uncharacterized protein BJ212DRAFT_1483035 [Suillus subaureus]|uniref:Fungal-type protein kinase domain-containing protein n=1 Tax=Suillus subaureus TaxID=48587 RepID=A0A9P7E642_9AGAM|nr:uncharacterized protein BJ212DRAFT_1483035 [Suillus subaureus]KAG1812397.1 hypothetical protein BJ212DRAFT_1483035 [Suillus subaureus]
MTNTQTVKFASAEWACPNKAVTPHTLHHLVLNLMGEKLTDFKSSHQLVLSVHDALLAHQDAYENTKILHQDLSVGNIMIFQGQGFLIDWDLAKLDIFVNCKQLDILVLELAQFFSHQYSVLPLEAHKKLVELQLSLKEILEEVGPVCMAAQQKIIDVAKSLLLESPAYQKEMGMWVLHSHKAIINMYNKHLGSSNWPDNDVAVWQKTHLLEKPSGHCLYTKSVCPSQDMTPIWVQITPSGKKHRLAPEDDVVAGLDDGLDDLMSFGS